MIRKDDRRELTAVELRTIMQLTQSILDKMWWYLAKYHNFNSRWVVQDFIGLFGIALLVSCCYCGIRLQI